MKEGLNQKTKLPKKINLEILVSLKLTLKIIIRSKLIKVKVHISLVWIIRMISKDTLSSEMNTIVNTCGTKCHRFVHHNLIVISGSKGVKDPRNTQL